MTAEPEIVPGDLITPPCQWKVNRKPCRWPRTKQVHGLWLCEICDRDWWLRQALRRARVAACKSIAKAKAKCEKLKRTMHGSTDNDSGT